MGNRELWDLFKKKALDRLSSESPVFVAEAGNSGESGWLCDYDLIIILDHETDVDKHHYDIYKKIISHIYDVEKEMYDFHGAEFVHFSSFRLQAFYKTLLTDEYFRKVNDDAHQLLIHLLIYPSVGCFIGWEPPSIVASLCENSRLLKGDSRIWDGIGNRVELPPFRDRLMPLFQVFWESYRDLFQGANSRILDEYHINNGIKVLHYVIKYASWEVILENEGTIPSSSLNVIQARILKYHPRLSQLLEELPTEQGEPDLDEVKRRYEALGDELARLGQLD